MRKQIFITLLTILFATGAMAQDDCFTYSEGGNTVITGLTEKGQAAKELTIPAQVTMVGDNAFYGNNKLTNLVIASGGDPLFETETTNALDAVKSTLSTIEIQGTAMTTDHIATMLSGRSSKGALETIEIRNNEFPLEGTFSWSNVSGVKVILPAARVNKPNLQQFGDATVCGRFTLTKAVGTFCTLATFQDNNDGGNFLFYVATEIANNQLHMQRVRYVKSGQGIVMHYLTDASTTVFLPRVSEDSKTDAIYGQNMLKGQTTAKAIEATDGTNTNLVLKDGAFHPTSGGTIPANRAYLQIPTSTWSTISTSGARMLMSFDDDETTGVESINRETITNNQFFDLQGRKVAQPTKGLYIVNGKKVVVR